MADPAFPNVPPFPGVPALSRLPGAGLLPQLARLTGDAPGVTTRFAAGQAPRWGIYTNDGITPLLTGEAVLSVDYDKEFQIPSYPVEQGGFQSYNKVARPREMRIRFAQGGTKFERERFLDKAASIVAETDLVSVVQPERFYSSMNFTRMHYDRESVGGPQLLVVELFAEEVRLTASSAFSNTQNPPDADATNQGTVQAQDPTPAQAAAITVPQ